ncbi:unnamed protein product [Staurois parvus]|uniref:BPTI/Kunitz inhibitor domain-containing protein n=1 Tax=Staurois parvus TaxID=386267 RepID=A0ABN9H979_9NEOB|nr:unnamed protein product [Staurois parvus]
MEAGPCLAHIIMWYYDQKRAVCDTFIWGGCQGNGNRFESRENCSALCIAPKKGLYPEPSNHNHNIVKIPPPCGRFLWSHVSVIHVESDR